MSIVFPEPCSTSTFLLVLLSYSSSSNIYCILPHIFPHLLLLLAANSFLSPTLLSSTSLCVQLLVYYAITRLFLLSMFHPSAYILFLSSTPSLPLSAILLLSILLLLPSLFSLLLSVLLCSYF